MKTNVLIFIFVLTLFYQSRSQDMTSVKNTIKYNPMGTLLWRSTPISFERKANKVVTFSIGGGALLPRKVSTSNISFQTDYVNATFNDSKLQGYFFTPEIRFYVTGKAPYGFYIGLYTRYMRYGMTIHGMIEESHGNIANFSARVSLSEYGSGQQLGYQWQIAERWTIDFFFAGPRSSVYTFRFKANADVDLATWREIETRFLEEYNAEMISMGLNFLRNRLPSKWFTPSANFMYPISSFNFRHGIAVGFRF
jgi:hypothetical protein